MTTSIGLCSLEAVKAWLSLDLTGQVEGPDDDILTSLGAAAEAATMNYTGRVFTPTSFTETYSGKGGAVLFTRQSPILSVASIITGMRTIPARQVPYSFGFTFDNNSILLSGSTFSPGSNNIAITYTAGFNPIPADVIQANVQAVSYWYSQRTNLGSLSTAGSMGGSSVHDVGPMPKMACEVLDKYRRLRTTYG